jgi:hypothetical protein
VVADGACHGFPVRSEQLLVLQAAAEVAAIMGTEIVAIPSTRIRRKDFMEITL